MEQSPRRPGFLEGAVIAAVGAVLFGCDGNGPPGSPSAAVGEAERPANPTGGYPLTVRDAGGRAIRVDKRPERIVVIGTPLYTEILFDLGAGDRIVGVSESPDNPAGAGSIETVGDSLGWSLERVLSLRPDVVFGAGRNVDKLERAGLTVISVGKPGGIVASVDDVISAIRTIGLVIHGDTGRAKRLARRLQEEIAAVEERVRGRPRPSAAFIYAPRQFAPTVAGMNTPEHELFLKAGARNIFEDISSYKTVNLEQLFLRDPDVIVTNIDQVPQLMEDPGLKRLRAVKGGKVFGVRSCRITSSRLASTLRDLARQFHPSAFPD